MTDSPKTVLTPKTEDARLEKRLDDLRAEITRLETDDRQAADYVDRAVLVGGSAAILASVTFLGDIAPHPTPGSSLFLILSWASFLFGATLALGSLFSTRATARAIRRMLKSKVDNRDVQVVAADYAPARGLNQLTKVFSRAGVVSFLLGAAFLLWFAIRNLPPEAAAGAVGRRPTISALSDSILATSLPAVDSMCAGKACLLILRYDFDLPRPPQTGTGSQPPSAPSPGPTRP